MNDGVFFLCVIVAVLVYNLLIHFMRRRERLTVIDKLSDEALAAYLGKAPEEDSSSMLDRSLWWLARLGSLTIGFAVAGLLVFFQDRMFDLSAGHLGDLYIIAHFAFFGAVGVLVELFVERRVRK